MAQPRLRFKRGDGTEYPEWEEKSVAEICENILGGGTPTTENKDYWNGDIAWVSSSDLDNNDIHHLTITRFITEEAIRCSATKKIPRDSVLIVSRVGVGKVVVAPCELCTSQDFTNIVKPKCNSLFLGYMLSIIMQTKANGVQGTSIKGVPAKEIKQYRISIPCLEEQQKIADFLSAVDEVILQSEAEVQNLEQQKKAAMQKIFSQEVRFRREDGTEYSKWQKYKIGDLFYKVNERNNGQFDKTKWISVAKMYYQIPDKVTSNNIDTRTYVMRLGDMAFEGHSNSEFLFGRFVVNDIGDGVISELFPIYRHKTDYVLKYWKYAIQIESVMAHIYRRSITSSGASSNKLNDDDFLNESIFVPCLEEQQKIADFLSTYDEAITYAKQEYDKWKELKKGLLQQMFV